MKSKIGFSIILMFLVMNGYSQDWYQYFDGADTSDYNSIAVEIQPDSFNIWQIGKPHKQLFDSAATMPNAIVTDTLNYYPSNNISRFQFAIVPWANAGIFALQWKQKIDFDEGSDGGLVEFSIDSGSTWNNAFNNPYVYNFYGFEEQNKDTLASDEFVFSGSDSTWRDIWLCFSMSWMQQINTPFYFRFTLKSDSVNNNKEGWLIDNMIARLTFAHTVKEFQSENYLTVFPNPANDVVYIETKKIQEFHIIEEMLLINELGQIIDEWKNIPTKFYIDAKKYKNGLYSLRIKTNIKSETTHLMIHHN